MKNIDSNNACEIVQDLLPLYYDGVCSEESRLLVEEHLKTCDDCRNMLNSLRNDSAEIEFATDAQAVLKHHAQKEKNIALMTGMIIAGILIVTVIIVLILTLPGYSDLKTDAVIIASMLLVAGMTVVPLVSKTKRFSKTIFSSTIALLLVIFFTEMFFDDGGLLMFAEIAFSVICAIVVLFSYPLLAQMNLPERLRKHKGVLSLCCDTISFYLMIFTFIVAYPAYVRELLSISTFWMLLVWMIFITARYLKINRWLKAGIITATTGIWASIGVKYDWVTIADMDLHREILVGSLIAAALLALIGLLKNKSNRAS